LQKTTIDQLKILFVLFAFTLASILVFADIPYSENISVADLPKKSGKIVITELISGKYNRNADKYTATLTVVSTIKGKHTGEMQISHQHGWNRLQLLGGYYLLYLDSENELMLTGSAIIPLEGYGPFRGSSLEEAAKFYQLPKGTWFSNSKKLWALSNCLGQARPTCEREIQLLKYTFHDY